LIVGRPAETGSFEAGRSAASRGLSFECSAVGLSSAMLKLLDLSSHRVATECEGLVDIEGGHRFDPCRATIQSHQTGDFQAESKWAVSVGISATIVPHFRSPGKFAVSPADLSPRSLHPRIPFPAAGLRQTSTLGWPGNLGSFWNHNGHFEPVIADSTRGLELLAPFCRGITSRSTPMPRGNRPFDRSAHEIRRKERE
jgi:hypothetical protein